MHERLSQDASSLFRDDSEGSDLARGLSAGSSVKNSALYLAAKAGDPAVFRATLAALETQVGVEICGLGFRVRDWTAKWAHVTLPTWAGDCFLGCGLSLPCALS